MKRRDECAGFRGNSECSKKCCAFLTALWVLVPVSKNLLGLFYLFLRAGEMEFQFSSSARDVNLDGGQTIALHSQVELFVSLANSVALKTCHG